MIFTKAIIRQLISNGENPGKDHKPVVKVFNPYGGGTWLFSEMDQDGRLFGLCDHGVGCPEVGYADRSEVEGCKVFGTLPLERDRQFKAEMTLSGYAAEARRLGRVEA